MISRQGAGGTGSIPPVSSQGYTGGSLINKRGPTSPNITQDYVGAWQAPPPPDPNFVPVDNNPTGSLLQRRGPGDTAHITPVQIAAAQAAYQPPVTNTAGAGAGNVGAGSFTSVGRGQGTFGQEQRRRLARGPMSGLSITPEMVRRAAMRRLG
jgi:hypothetical protein